MRGSEFELIEEIRRKTPTCPSVLVGIGDDSAVLAPSGLAQLVTCDMLLEGVHFDLAKCTPREVGRKAMAVNLSDIAAMAGMPRAAVVAVGLPSGMPVDLPRELHEGIAEMASQFGVALIGGDTNRSNTGLVVSITLLGEPTNRGPVLRLGARIGDKLCVTGQLGGSILGKHLHFVPRVAEAQFLHQRFDLHAMLDISDGLGGDVFHLLRESSVGAVLDADRIPISAAALQLAHGNLDLAWSRALDDGEDFELLFALSTDEALIIEAEQPLRAKFGVDVAVVGDIVSGSGAKVRRGTEIEKLEPRGYVHSV